MLKTMKVWVVTRDNNGEPAVFENYETAKRFAGIHDDNTEADREAARLLGVLNIVEGALTYHG